MPHSHKNEEPLLLSLADFKHIYLQWKGVLFKGAMLGAVLAIALVLLTSVKYTAEAGFYEKAKSDSVGNNSKNAALLLLGEEKESSAIVMLKSEKIIEAAIKKLDLQAVVTSYSFYPRFVSKVVERLSNPWKNLSAQWAISSRSVHPLDVNISPELVARNVRYEEEVPFYLDVQFSSSRMFTVRNPKDDITVEGELGVPVVLDQPHIRFTLEANQPLDFNGRRFEVAFRPGRKIAQEVANNLKVVSDYKDKSFITMTLTYETRKGTSELLNAIMESYQQYLADEHHRVVASQVAYLKERRGTMEGHLAALMHEHAEQISAHAGNLDLLIATQQNLQKKLLTADLEIKHLQQTIEKGAYTQAHYISESDPPLVHQTVAEIRNLRHQSAAIELALNDLPKKVRPQSEEQDFQGIDLSTANTLYLSYCRELQEAEVNAIQNRFIIEKVGEPTFELTSLSSVLTDPVSSEIIKKAGSLTLAIKDQGNRTQRELERLNGDLELQRNFLTGHLQQIVELLKLRVELLYSKIQAVQEASLALLQQKISLHEQQLSDYASARLNTLKLERELTQKQKVALQEEFEKLPAQWASEKLIDLYLTTDGSLMQHIGSLIESKNIADHLEISLSAPFDYSIPPLHPKSPHLFLFGLLGAFVGVFGVACFALMQSVMSGIDVTVDNLRLAGGYVAGKISEGGQGCSANNLETLRHLTAYLCPANTFKPEGGKGRSLLVLESTGPSYASELALLLSKRRLKVILIEVTFDGQEQNQGLFGYLEGTSKNVNVIRKEDYDLLPAGGFSAYGAELIESPAFRELMQEFLLKYDWIIAVSRAVPCSAEAEGVAALFDCEVITVTHEKLHALTGYINRAKPCAFVLCGI